MNDGTKLVIAICIIFIGWLYYQGQTDRLSRENYSLRQQLLQYKDAASIEAFNDSMLVEYGNNVDEADKRYSSK